MRGYRRTDGLYEVDGRVADVKNHPMQPPGRDTPLPPGKPVHDMSVRLVVDEAMTIVDVVVAIDAGPYADCPHAIASLEPLRGAQIGAGWTKRVKALLGGEACTHLVELMIPMATTVHQTLAPTTFERPDKLDADGKPVRIDSCYAYGHGRALVRMRWPERFPVVALVSDP